MKLKTLTFGTLAASTMMLASTVASPAMAATVTGTLNLAQDSGVNSISGTKIDFVNTNNFFSVGQSSTGTFAGLKGSGVTILNDLTLPFSGAFDFLKVNGGPIFKITGISSSTTQTSSNFSLFNANVLGNFTLGGDVTPASSDSFVLTAITTNGKFTNISLDSAAAVPTPALLPGLVGMGVAALRKRKSEDLESADV